MSARKVRPFADLVRGKSVDEALQLLRFKPNRAARLVEAVLKSAMGNADDRGARDVEDLLVSEARIDDGPMFKRIMPRARGTAFMILRRMCHIHVAIAEEEVEETTTAAPAVAVTTPAEPAPNVAPAPAPEQPATT
jgi:large subunit ribosomal protein L22